MGGKDIQIEEAPYHVGYGDVCSGVLVRRRYALTAAHCGTNINYIRVGSNIYNKGPKVKIRSHTVHPKFGRKRHNFDYDIQILELHRWLHASSKISPIKLYKGRLKQIKTVNVSGWGYPKEKSDYNRILQQVELNVVSIKNCQKVNYTPFYNHTLTARMFCADGHGKKDACQGDSGGPAVSSGYLVGISSFGYGCGRVPGVYTKITNKKITKWLNKYIKY